jgi:hypothetical protein
VIDLWINLNKKEDHLYFNIILTIAIGSCINLNKKRLFILKKNNIYHRD